MHCGKKTKGSYVCITYVFFCSTTSLCKSSVANLSKFQLVFSIWTKNYNSLFHFIVGLIYLFVAFLIFQSQHNIQQLSICSASSCIEYDDRIGSHLSFINVLFFHVICADWLNQNVYIIPHQECADGIPATTPILAYGTNVFHIRKGK